MADDWQDSKEPGFQKPGLERVLVCNSGSVCVGGGEGGQPYLLAIEGKIKVTILLCAQVPLKPFYAEQ